MSKIKGILAATMAMALMADTSILGSVNEPLTENKAIRPVPKVVPKGSREYFFNAQGEFSASHMLKTECVFKCVAINDKSAIRKYNKFKKGNQQC